MMSVIATLSLGGYWKIYDPDSVRTSFPSFLNLIKKVKKAKNTEYSGEKYLNKLILT